MCWLSFLLFRLSLQQESQKESFDQGQDQGVLKGYQLVTRQLPPQRIKLLKDDILCLYLFDYTSYPHIEKNKTVDFAFKFKGEGPFYTFHENKNQPNLSYVLISASKIKTHKPVQLSYTITANFTVKQKNKTKRASCFIQYNMTVQVIDKYKASKANIENFEEGFTFRMRSNDTDVLFPVNADDIFGNNMNVSLKQIDENSSQTPEVGVKISPRVTIQNQSYYQRSHNSRIVSSIGTSLTSAVVIRQRIDKPWLFRLNFMSYDMFGNINIFASPIFNQLELVNSMKINSYTHILTLNTEHKEAYMLMFLLKMSPKDPLPLTRLFYPEYKLVYYQIGSPMYDSSYSWKNFENIWVFKLEKSTVVRQSKGGSILEQKVKIFQIFLPEQSIQTIGDFSLNGLKSQLDAKFDLTRSFADIKCRKIEMFTRVRGVLGCLLLPSNSQRKPPNQKSLEVFISINLKRDREKRFTFEVQDMVTSINPEGKHLDAVCLINFWQSETTKAKQEYLIKPFALVYHDQGAGYYMKSQTNQWIELMKDTEISQEFTLKDTFCQFESKTLILEFQKELKKKRKIYKELKKRTWSKSVTYLINLDSAYRGDNRIIKRVEKHVAFGHKTNQIHSLIYIKETRLLVYGFTGQISQNRDLYYRISVDMKYPKITLSTNSTENFTANMKIYIYSNAEDSEEAYGFPFKVQAQAVERFQIEPRTNKSAPVLKNGKHNLEEYFRTTGPMNSIQQVTNNMGRLRFASRAFWWRTAVDTKPDFLHIEWFEDYYFVAYTKNIFYLEDGQNESQSVVSYTEEIKAVTRSCCSSTLSFYALHYNPKLVNSLSVRLLDIIPNYKNKNKTLLKSYQKKYIDSRMVSNIQLASSKMFLKSVGDQVLAICIHDKELIKILILDYVHKDRPIVTPMKEISTRTFGGMAKIRKVAIVSMMTEITSLRSLVVLIGTRSHIITEFVYYNPSIKDRRLRTSFLQIPKKQSMLTLNSSVDYIQCSNAEVTHSGTGKIEEPNLLINSKCLISSNGYLMKSFIFTAKAVKITDSSQKHSFSLITPEFQEFEVYEIPRFYKTVSMQQSPYYLAVHVRNTEDNHQEILIYKRSRRYVWTSIYASADMEATYSIGEYYDGTSWVFVDEIGSELKVYLIGDMTLEVKEGYDTTGQLRMLYSTFERPSEVLNFSQDFIFSDNFKRKSNLLLVVYGSVGGFFGMIVVIGCCCCFWRCVYVGFVKRFQKREKRMIPVLVKKHKKKKN